MTAFADLGRLDLFRAALPGLDRGSKGRASGGEGRGTSTALADWGLDGGAVYTFRSPERPANIREPNHSVAVLLLLTAPLDLGAGEVRGVGGVVM